ncbi:MAG: DUF1512 family protein [Candidatus Nanohaloarchaea archaeon]
MVLPGLFPGSNNGIFAIIQTLISLLFLGMIFFFPRIMMWQVDRKLKSLLVDLDTYRNDAEMMFLKKLDPHQSKAFQRKFDSMKDFKFSAPTALDPAGMVQRLENVLDASEDKFDRFVQNNTDTDDEEELANLNMAFKGVMGTNQIYKVMRHFRQLISKTKTFQLIGIVQMMMPIYEEIAEAQRDATRAFVDQAPTGDGIGPLVAAKMITGDAEEISEDIVHSEEEVDGQEVHVLKSKGPGARLGKYGDAVNTLAEENDLEAIITVDAAGKFEGEETGKVSEGVGVMMGGAGVEKSKIEDAATGHDIPLEGVAIMQSPAEASKPMKKAIYEAWNPAVEKTEEILKEFDGPVAVVGVGNSCGVANSRDATSGIHSKLQKYWKEYEEEEEEVSYQGLLGAMPGGDSAMEGAADSFLWRIPRW